MLESRATSVWRIDPPRKETVSRRKRVSIRKIAERETMDPRFVPSRRSIGTLRYMSRFEAHWRYFIVLYCIVWVVLWFVVGVCVCVLGS